jgi:Protein of unknown function (DUF2905)
VTAPSLGPMLVIGGLLIVLIGLAVWSGALGWFGRLPGDIRIEREGVRVYVPIVSMLLLSLLLTLALNLINRFRGR